jgi:hypothetical protein
VLVPPVGGNHNRELSSRLSSLVAGGWLGGLMLGLAVGTIAIILSRLPEARIGISLGLIGAGVVASLTRRVPWWTPQRTCQVSPYRIVAQGPRRAAFAWGVELGVGIRTFVVTPAIYALVGVALLARSIVLCALLCCIYGAARAGTIAGMAFAVRRRLQIGNSQEPLLGVASSLHVVLAFAAALTAAVVMVMQ